MASVGDVAALDSDWSSIDPGQLAKPLLGGDCVGPLPVSAEDSQQNEAIRWFGGTARTGNSTNKLSSAYARTGHVQILIWFTCATTEMEK